MRLLSRDTKDTRKRLAHHRDVKGSIGKIVSIVITLWLQMGTRLIGVIVSKSHINV